MAEDADPSSASLPLVIVAEDDPAVQRLMERALPAFGYEAHIAGNLAALLSVLAERASDVCCLVLDFSLLEGDPAGGLAQVRKPDGGLPIIMVSGFSRDDVERVTGELPGGTFLQKPYTMDVLRTVIDAHRRV